MPFDAEMSEERGLILLNGMGDVEITWEPQNDEKMRAVIQKKMEEGVTFFVLKPIVGDVLHMRRKLKKMSDLKAHNVKIKDADIETLFTAGEIAMMRSERVDNGAAIRVRDDKGNLDHAAASRVASRTRSVGVPALRGG